MIIYKINNIYKTYSMLYILYFMYDIMFYLLYNINLQKKLDTFQSVKNVLPIFFL